MSKIQMDALKKVVKAWESLSGGTSYSSSVIGDWLSYDMKPAIDNARKVIKNETK